MKIQRAGARPSAQGPDDWFTGHVRLDPLFAVEAPSAMAGNLVTFDPGARTAWHTHPLEQTLLIVQGLGWVQHEGGAIEEVRPGDVVRFAPDERHWHGASRAAALSHVAIQKSQAGQAVTWMEPVSDEEYQR